MCKTRKNAQFSENSPGYLDGEKKRICPGKPGRMVTLIIAFTACYLPYQQHHNITIFAREHIAETYLKELGTSDSNFLTLLIHKDAY